MHRQRASLLYDPSNTPVYISAVVGRTYPQQRSPLRCIKTTCSSSWSLSLPLRRRCSWHYFCWGRQRKSQEARKVGSAGNNNRVVVSKCLYPGITRTGKRQSKITAETEKSSRRSLSLVELSQSISVNTRLTSIHSFGLSPQKTLLRALSLLLDLLFILCSHSLFLSSLSLVSHSLR